MLALIEWTSPYHEVELQTLGLPARMEHQGTDSHLPACNKKKLRIHEAMFPSHWTGTKDTSWEMCRNEAISSRAICFLPGVSRLSWGWQAWTDLGILPTLKRWGCYQISIEGRVPKRRQLQSCRGSPRSHNTSKLTEILIYQPEWKPHNTEFKEYQIRGLGFKHEQNMSGGKKIAIRLHLSK